MSTAETLLRTFQGGVRGIPRVGALCGTDLLRVLISTLVIIAHSTPETGSRRERLAPIPGIVKAEESPESLLVRAEARMRKAKLLLGKGAADEAGEEAWRAVIDAINAAAAALWGVAAKSHKATGYLVKKIADYIERTWGRERADAFRSSYGNAESLHGNFYNPTFDAKTVEANIRQAERVISIARNIVNRTRGGGLPRYFTEVLKFQYIPILFHIKNVLETTENIMVPKKPWVSGRT